MRSYAQNFEDVMLMRAFRGIARGFYVDIGAADPVTDSVTLAFYERGWRGIDVEPCPDFAALLRAARPGDAVVEALIGEETGDGPLFRFLGTGLSTVRPDIARRQAERGFVASEISVRWLSLAGIFDLAGGAEIQFLKVDVEGAEATVLRSWGEHEARPWILVIEATLPSSPVPCFEEWEPEVLKRGYKFVWFDGLNRFYVHEAHAELGQSFDAPANCFDGFDLADHSPFVVGLRAEANALAAENAHLRAHSAEKEEQVRSTLAAMTAQSAAFSAVFDTLKADLGAVREQREAYASEIARLQEAKAAQASEQAATNALLDILRVNLVAEQAARRSADQDCAAIAAAREQALRDLEASRAAEAAAGEAACQVMVAKDAAIAEAIALRRVVEALRSSMSWRISAPLRWAGRLARAGVAFAKDALRPLLERSLAFVRRHPRVKKAALSTASLVPPVKAKLLDFAAARSNRTHPLDPPPSFVSEQAKHSSREARAVLSSLRAARQRIGR